MRKKNGDKNCYTLLMIFKKNHKILLTKIDG